MIKMIECKHEETEVNSHEFHVNDDGSTVQIIDYICLGCSRKGHRKIMTTQIKWFDEFQTTLVISD